MPPVDLSRAQARYAEKLLVDRCTITYDAEQQRDDDFDETTGEYGTPGSGSGDEWGPEDVVSGEPCKVKAFNRSTNAAGTAGLTGGAPMAEGLYEVTFAATFAHALVRGHLVEITESVNAQLVGKRLHVRTRVDTTLFVGRKYICSERVDALNRG